MSRADRSGTFIPPTKEVTNAMTVSTQTQEESSILDCPAQPSRYVLSPAVVPRADDVGTSPSVSKQLFSTSRRPSKTRRGEGNAVAKAHPISKPKRALTSYNLFFRDHRNRIAKLRREHPDCPSIAKMISIVWKKLDPAQRAHYDMLAAQEKFSHYAKRQAWLHFQETQKLSPSEGFETTSEASVTSQDMVDDEEGPLSIETAADVAAELDSESIDFILRALR